MSIIKTVFLIGCIFQLCISKNIERIEFVNKLEIPCFIEQVQTYEITFNSLENIPDYVQISFSSANNIQQIVSFSSKNDQCLNGKRFKSNKSNFYLEKSQLSLNKNFICVECPYPYKDCELKISLLEGKLGPKLEEEKEKLNPNIIQKLKHNLKTFEKIEDDDDVILKISSDIKVDLYTLNSGYTERIQIPSSKKTYYQIDSKENGKYKIISGKSVTVRADGMVYPKNETWYWYGNVGTTSPPREDQTPTYIEISYTLGKSVISATVGSNTYQVTINVLDYASEYVEAKIDAYIKANVTTKTTNLEKLKAITAYPASFPYSAKYSGYISMIIFEGGDCWASSSTIQHLCEKVGIKSYIRYAANDGGAGSGHRNVIAYIDNKYYICEAGYGYTRPNRPYNVYEELLGYSTRTQKDGIIIYQYDGYDQEIFVPSSINNKTVIGMENTVFIHGPAKTATKIILPDTITFIGNSVFNSLPNITNVIIPKNVQTIGLYVFAGSNKIEKIIVDDDNDALCSEDDILYNKNKTTIINYPPGKVKDSYEGLSSLERFENYSFYYVKHVKTVIIPKRVNYIGEGAFGDSSVKEVYFAGDPPILGEFIFYNLNLSVYYPIGSSKKWEKYVDQKFSSKAIRWYTWEPPESSESDESNEPPESTESNESNKSNVPNTFNYIIIIPCLIIVILIIAVIVFICLRKVKKSKINSNDYDSKFKSLLPMNMH